MARKSPKCPPTVEPNQSGCIWSFNGMFDHHHHHHGRPHRKLLSFDEQLRSINIESKKKQSLKEETSSSNHTTTIEKSFWKKIKSRYENPNKKKENPIYNSIVVLKPPSQRVIESPVDVGCMCSYLHSHHKSTSNQQIVKHNRVSFNDVRKKLKDTKKVKKKKKNIRKGSEPGQNDENAPRPEKLQLVPFLKQGEPDVFVEARRHLAERLRQVVKGECEGEASSSKRVSRTLERVLLSSPIHMSIANFYRGIDDICVEKSLLTMDSDPNSIGAMEVSQMEMTLDVSSPKVNFKLENMENDQFRENPSPVSVLESIFADNSSSPTSTIESSVEHHIQPRCLDFEEHSQTSSPSHQKTSLSSFMEDRGLISAYVNEIYEASESNWEDFLATDYPSELSCDHKLVHDCVKEVLIGLNMRIMFVSSKIRAFSLEEDVVNEVMEQVEWHNGRFMIPRTLDNLVRRDIAKGGEWVHVADGNDVVFEVVDETLQVLIMEAISDISV
ncbi:uncharacterized protein LOC111900372 [Lactuca sativa]|uniref:DUF4378 domain-containing protein n=1 Tax=Lactuca sativa TaxID=4236 RepID=A0A9R1V9W8_LACSA|nr:uncharacterized protein LOC111900372 [Lactuca sativa]XP_042751571.1 uncharacterized protein LOC111900372 [Lactuca sativa]KAJ0202355.1 hypothetical protein LSAT_V11C600301180 [Lactuca sativa]